MKIGYQLVPLALPSVAFVAGARVEVKTDKIRGELNGRPAHVARIDFELTGTPTLSSGVLTAEELNNIFSKITIKDGVRTLFDESQQALRHFEALENGGLLAGEPDDIATATEFSFVRSWHPGMRQMAGGLLDFVIPPGAFDGTPIELNCSALASIDANLTALSLTVQTIVWLAILDDVRIPPTLERKTQSLRSDETITGEDARFAFIGLTRPAFAAMAAGDLGSIQVVSTEAETQAIHVAALEKAYHIDMEAGSVSIVHGEPRSATDDNPKVIAGGGTALASAAAKMSPIIWTPKGGRLTKLMQVAKDKGLSFRWTGTLAPAQALVTRLRKRQRDVAAAYLELAAKSLKVPIASFSGDVATLSKKPYAGEDRDYMPLKMKIR